MTATTQTLAQASYAALFVLSMVVLAYGDVIVRFDSPSHMNRVRSLITTAGYNLDTQNLTLTLRACPISYPSNQVVFDDFNSTLVASNASTVLSSLLPGTATFMSLTFPQSPYWWIERWAAAQWAQYRPNAFLAFGGPFEAGGLQCYKWSEEYVMNGITSPFLHMQTSAGELLRTLLHENNGTLQIVVTCSPENPYARRKDSGKYIFLSVFTGTWALGVLILAIVTLSLRGIHRNIATLCVLLDSGAAVLRIVYALDPFAGRFINASILTVIFTAPVPMVLVSCILITSFWYELATQASLEVSGVLTSTKLPTIIVIIGMFAIEVISSCLRAVRYESGIATGVAAIYYIIVTLVLIVFYTYVSIKVFILVRSSLKLKRSQKILRNFSLRAVCSIGGLMLCICAEALFISRVNENENLEGWIDLLTKSSENWISTTQLLALLASSRAVARSKSSPNPSSKTKSGLQS